MRDDFLTAQVARLLSEPYPTRTAFPKGGTHLPSLVGQATNVFEIARDLAVAADHAEAVADWHLRHDKLRAWRDELDGGVDDARRDALIVAVEEMRVRGRARWEQTVSLLKELASAYRRGSSIIDDYRTRQIAITQHDTMTDMPLRERERVIMNQMQTRDRIDAETRRVLDLHHMTTAISVTDLYAAKVQQN